MCINYIQEYLGYQWNNLYFLFSHSLPVIGYHFGQVQPTNQVERKTICSKKRQGYSLLDCLVFFISTKGIAIKLGTYIDVNKRKCRRQEP